MMNIAILTGAGISTESGFPTFQNHDNNWPFKKDRWEILSIYNFMDNREEFWNAHEYIFPREALHNAQPSSFHRTCQELESKHQVTIITQNIDGLHQKAGSTHVIELHGNKNTYECLKIRNSGCGITFNENEAIFIKDMPHCPQCKQIAKPNSSLYGEGVRDFGLARDIIIESDLFIVAGTSLETGPANELPLYHQARGSGNSLWINVVQAPIDYDFTDSIIEDAKNISLEKIEKYIY